MEDHEKLANVPILPESRWDPFQVQSHMKANNGRVLQSKAVLFVSALVAVVAILYLWLFQVFDTTSRDSDLHVLH